MSTSTTKTKDMVTTAMFVAIILAMSFVPYLGYIPLGFMNELFTFRLLSERYC